MGRGDSRLQPMSGPFFFDHDALAEVAAQNHEAFRSARPFPHAVFDGLLPDEVVQGALDEFPDLTSGRIGPVPNGPMP